MPDTTATPPITNQPTGDRSAAVYGQGNLGLLENLDLGLLLAANAFGDSPMMLRLKYQFLGASHLAHQSGFSLAVTAAGGFSPHMGTDSFMSVSSTTESSEWAYDFALIAGYRGNETVMLYGGPFVTRAGASGTIHQNNSGTTTDYTFSGSSYQAGEILASSSTRVWALSRSRRRASR